MKTIELFDNYEKAKSKLDNHLRSNILNELFDHYKNLQFILIFDYSTEMGSLSYYVGAYSFLKKHYDKIFTDVKKLYEEHTGFQDFDLDVLIEELYEYNVDNDLINKYSKNNQLTPDEMNEIDCLFDRLTLEQAYLALNYREYALIYRDNDSVKIIDLTCERN